MITVQEVVDALKKQGYRELGGSDVWRYLEHFPSSQHIKVYYNDYNTKDYVIVRESCRD